MKSSKYWILVICSCCSILLPQGMSAQCSSINMSLWENIWESCERTQSPNASRGESHWIMYDLGKTYTLSNTRIWNANIDLDKGVKSLIVDFSLDGDSWIALDTLEIAKAKGDSDYTGEIGPDFRNAKVRFILLHIESNWGHRQCSGFTELSIYINERNEDASGESTNEDEDEDENVEEEEDDENTEEGDDTHDPEDCDEVCDDCNTPVNTTALVLTSNEVWILWEGETTDTYIVFIRSADEEWIEIQSEEPELFIEDLESGADYEFFVQSICEDGEVLSSKVKNIFIPEESEECVTPLYSDGFFSQGGFVIVAWQGSDEAEMYEIRYRTKEDNEEWTTYQCDENVIEVESLDFEMQYEYQVRVLCDGEWLEWSETFDLNSNTQNFGSSIEELTQERSISKSLDVNVFPNPARRTINFTVESDSNTTLLFQLSDISGEEYYINSEKAISGRNTYELKGQNLSAGMYFLTVKDMVSQFMKVSRVVVIKE